MAYSFIDLAKETFKLVESFIIDFGIGLTSISWTQKVKLFYASLLASNSH